MTWQARRIQNTKNSIAPLPTSTAFGSKCSPACNTQTGRGPFLMVQLLDEVLKFHSSHSTLLVYKTSDHTILVHKSSACQVPHNSTSLSICNVVLALKLSPGNVLQPALTQSIHFFICVVLVLDACKATSTSGSKSSSARRPNPGPRAKSFLTRCAVRQSRNRPCRTRQHGVELCAKKHGLNATLPFAVPCELRCPPRPLASRNFFSSQAAPPFTTSFRVNTKCPASSQLSQSALYKRVHASSWKKCLPPVIGHVAGVNGLPLYRLRIHLQSEPIFSGTCNNQIWEAPVLVVWQLEPPHSSFTLLMSLVESKVLSPPQRLSNGMFPLTPSVVIFKT